MTKHLEEMIKAAATWSEEDQAELAAHAREIEARQTDVYVMSDDERAAVNEGLAQLDRGEVISGDKLYAFWRRLGLL